MRWASLMVGFALMASPTFAQSLGGVRLGMSEAEALAVLRGGKAEAVDNPSSTSIYSERGDVWADLCDGVVTAISVNIGFTISDFTSAVFEIERSYGKPTYDLLNLRQRNEPFGNIKAHWVTNFGQRYVVISQIGDGKTYVTRGIKTTRDCKP